MTGAELRSLRRKMSMPIVRFGIEVLGSRGNLNTVSRYVRRLESADEVSDIVAAKVRAAVRNRRRHANGGY